MNRAARAAVGCVSPRVARKRASRAAGLRSYETEVSVHRGHCRAPGCASRYGVDRVTLDTTSTARVERFAHRECAQCGRVWHRVKDDTPVSRLGYQAVRITLIVPTGERRIVFASHGGVHAEGETSVVLRDATFGQLTDAYSAWQKRNNAVLAARARAKARKAELDAAATREFMAQLAAMDERRRLRDEERMAEERAADERERKGQA